MSNYDFHNSIYYKPKGKRELTTNVEINFETEAEHAKRTNPRLLIMMMKKFWNIIEH